ncbi:UTP6 [Bugula neritina]|uniref:UTP6 n=1 Tax=Bugula neritina TaxID=10212 RepID=A0A7J7KB19_BUGNE|nr:UTP6 [Bugula neritina]
MGEYVQQTLEEMTNEVQQLEHAGLKIISRRKLFEYKLRRRVKDKQDYLMYVKYETKLLELIWLRRKTKGYNDKKVEIEGAILQRINKLFRLACRNWPQASELWESRIHFVKKVEKNRTQVSSLYTRALQVITNVPFMAVIL